MRPLQWCMLGVTVLLLMCEVAISQLCKSLITLVDGFHTLFLLAHMALPLTADTLKPPLSSSSTSPPRASTSSSSVAPPIHPPPATHNTTEGSNVSHQPPSAQTNPEVTPHRLSGPKLSPGPLNCGLSFSNIRIRAVGVFLSTLLLASLCTSYLMEIANFFLDPHPVQQPLLLVVVASVSLLHKMLVFGLNWDRLQDERAGEGVEHHLHVNHKVLAEEESIGLEECGRSSHPRGQSAAHNSGTLILCNPETSSIPDIYSQSPLEQQPGVCPQTCESSSEDLRENTDGRSASLSSAVWESLHQKLVPFRRWPVCLLSFVFVIQGVFTSLLALINSLVMLLIAPQFPHSSDVCNPLVYLDPALSLLAAITLIVAALPQLYRYGLLLLQATPPHICVSDVGRRIESVPGVQAVHDLHIWQLTESLTVASVHVHCYTGFPTQRCVDVLSGVTKVLQSVGVSCCTVQPEFASLNVSSAGDGGDTSSPVIHREDPSPPPLLACSLACRKACAGSMCCSLLQDDTQSRLAPPAGETKDEPQTLVIENTFL